MILQNILTQKRLSFIYRAGIFLILTLPLISAPPYFHPADWGKSIVFRIIFSILLFLFAWEMFLYPDRKNEIFSTLKSSKIIWIMGALAFIFLLATIFSLDPFFSFWGSPYRGDGSLNFILYILFGIFCFINAKKEEWQKLWDFTFLIGLLVSFVGISQSSGLLKGFLVSYDQASATMGSSVLFGLYLTLLIFMALSFALITKGKKVLFYYFSLLVFLTALNFSASRAAFLGIGAGLLFFIFFYKNRNNNQEKKLNNIFWIKIIVAILVAITFLTIFYIKDNSAIIGQLSKSRISSGLYRIVLTVQAISNTKNLIPDTRLSAWQIGINAFKNRPLLGYGPENFSIAFDKYFDPSFSQFGKLYWWDRAHNFTIEMLINAGIFALIIYLSLIFFVFWKLQNLKKGNSTDYLIFHGIQATFIAYITANFLGIDSFSTYMLFYFIMGYCCFLIYKKEINTTKTDIKINEKGFARYIFLVSVLLLSWFIWNFNIKPLIINKEVNWSDYYLQTQEFQKSINKMEKALSSRSIIENYVLLKYVNALNVLSETPQGRNEDKVILTRKRIDLLRKSVEIRPYYTRSWLFLGSALHNLATIDKNLSEIDANKLKQESISNLKKAQQLCPKCENIFIGLIRGSVAAKEYMEAEKTADDCVQLFPDNSECWWLKGIIKIVSNDITKGKEFINIATGRKYATFEYNPQQELLNAYVSVKDKNQSREYYKDLILIYERLIELSPKNYQWHASLAFVYRTLGEYAKAKKQALIMLELDPKLKPSVEAFLKTLPY